MQNKRIIVLLCLFLASVMLFGCSANSTSTNGDESLTPANIEHEYLLGLKSYTKADGVFTANGVSIKCDSQTLKDRATALFAETGPELCLTIDQGFAPEGAPAAVLDQAYKIEVGDTVTVTARAEVGLYYGALAVSQYIKLQGGMAYGTYVDWPDVAERCLHLDIARKYYSKDWIIDYIKDVASFKMNAVELHFSENEGFRIQCDTDPAVMSDQYLTKDEVREIIAAAKELYVEIIPSFDSPGHLMQALSAHPEYTLTDVDGYNSPKTLDITNPQAVAYIKSLLDEYAELFKDCKSFNIGGDESFGWSNVARMQFSAWRILKDYALETYGFDANAHDAFVGYINDIADYMQAKGFKVRAWNDGLMRTSGQAAVNKVDADMGILYWTNNATLKATRITPYLEGGYDIYNVNEEYMYYVLKEGFNQPDAKKIYQSWHAGLLVGADGKDSPNKFASPAELGDCLKGAYFCIWSDKPETQTAERVKTNSIAAARAMAVKAWNYKPALDYTTYQNQVKKIK